MRVKDSGLLGFALLTVLHPVFWGGVYCLYEPASQLAAFVGFTQIIYVFPISLLLVRLGLQRTRLGVWVCAAVTLIANLGLLVATLGGLVVV